MAAQRDDLEKGFWWLLVAMLEVFATVEQKPQLSVFDLGTLLLLWVAEGPS